MFKVALTNICFQAMIMQTYIGVICFRWMRILLVRRAKIENSSQADWTHFSHFDIFYAIWWCYESQGITHPNKIVKNPVVHNK